MRKLLILLLIGAVNRVNAQEVPTSLIDRVNSVNYIFEGEVLESTPYYSNNGKYIRTSNLVQITKILKGELQCGTIEIITNGGEINDERLEISHSLILTPGSMGIFLCNDTDRPLSPIDFYNETNLEKLEASFENQSFIMYWWDGASIQAADLWNNFDSLNLVYNITEQITGLNFQDCGNSYNLSNIGYQNKPHKNNEIEPKADSLITFTPHVLAAGINDTLTICGHSFGNTKGFFLFPNADNGGISQIMLQNNDIALWTDSLIKLVIPSSVNTAVPPATSFASVGSGTFEVYPPFGSAILIDTIKVEFSAYNTNSRKPFVYAPWNSMNKKFTFHCDTAVANYDSGKMKQSINKALLDWKCLTGIDWELGSDIIYSDTIALSDTVCTISFKNYSDSLNILAETQVWASGSIFVALNDTSYHIREVDVLINSDHIWFCDTISTNSVPPLQEDFYETILHELGHAHGLNHVIDSLAVMHYVDIANSRILNLSNDLSCDHGGNWIADFTNNLSNPIYSTALTRMVFDSIKPCSSILSVIELVIPDHCNFNLFPNPCEHEFTINFADKYSKINNYVLIDINGNIVTNSTKVNDNTINVSQVNSGIYFIRFYGSEGVFMGSAKFIKE